MLWKSCEHCDLPRKSIYTIVMERRWLAAPAILLALIAGNGLADDRTDVLQADTAFKQAEVQNDVKALDRLVADDYSGTDEKGQVVHKRDLLQGHTISIGALGQLKLRLQGDVAVVDGAKLERTYVKRTGRWLLLSTAERPAVPGTHPVTGRPYAVVMGTAGADWLVRPEREEEEEPDKAIAALKIAPGSTVADIGAGVGYFSWRLAKVVGPSGKVYSNDVQPEMIQRLKENMRERSITNVVPVLGKFDDPMLPKAAIDLAIMVDVYHEFSQPQKMLDHLRESLKPDGRLVLLEYRKEDPAVPIKELHKMTVQEVKAEIEPEGYKLDQVLEMLPRQHILIFKVAAGVR